MKSAQPSFAQAGAIVAAHAERLSRLRLAPSPAPSPAKERVELGQAFGRVLAQTLSADRDQPPFARSTRDGYACRAAEASSHKPLTVAGASRAGDPPTGPLLPGTVWEIMNGAPVPTGANAVMSFDHVETSVRAKLRKVRLLPPRTLKPGDNIVAQGAQARAGDELLRAGTALHAGQIALAAACGYTALDVFVRPRVAILTTGDELVSVGSSPAPGQIRNSNAPMLAALVAAAGGEPWVLPSSADNAQALDEALSNLTRVGELRPEMNGPRAPQKHRAPSFPFFSAERVGDLEPQPPPFIRSQAVFADLLLISGGVSAGKFDLVEAALSRRKAKFHFTGVRIQPGKPTVFGELPRGKGLQTLSFFGLPGNPVASTVAFLLFAAPLLAALTCNLDSYPRFALARLASQHSDLGWRAKAGITRFLPAFCNFGASAGQPPQVALVPSHGSGDLVALAGSNCFLVVPEDARKLKSGSLVRILLF